MVKRLSTVVLLGLAATVTAPRAEAQFANACGGTDFLTCITLQVSGQTTSQLEFTVTNVSGGLQANNPNSTLFEFGIGSSAYSGTAPVVTTPLSTRFDVFSNTTVHPNPDNGAGLTNGIIFGLNAKPAPPTNGLHAGETASFFLQFVNAASATSFLSGFQFAAHDGGGLQGCGSSKVVFDATGHPTTASSAASAGGTCNPTSTVPEPSSMALLGTGLFGLVPMIRRRRK